MDSPRRVELLAPAGGPPALEAAVRCGADAVYLGAGPFHARQNAQNFSLEDLPAVCGYCHARGVAVHLTLNTLIRPADWRQALEVAAQACDAGVDALILQDWGLAAALRAAAPDMRLHASTQTSVHTPEGVYAAAKLGFQRVILAREMSADEIAAACAAARDCGVETEVFVHGALCMSVSGQCRMSGMLGGRSANRGQCAQPCRLPFRAEGGTGFDLSLRDLCLLDHVTQLADAGVDSLKIEGRMKRPEYVAAAVTAYRRVLDGEPVSEEERDRLRQVFSRGGLTDGYYGNQRGRAMFGHRTGEDSRAAKDTYAPLHALYRLERPAVPVTVNLSPTSDGWRLTAADRQGMTGTADLPGAGDAPAPLEPDRLRAQLQKSGGTPFAVTAVTLPAVPVPLRLSAVNDLRRRALEDLLTRRASPRPVTFTAPPEEPAAPAPFRQGPLPLRLRFGRPDQIPDDLTALSGYQALYLPPEWPDALFARLLAAGLPVGADLPRGLFGCETAVLRRLETLRDNGIRLCLAHNVGTVAAAARIGLTVCAGEGCHLTNPAAGRALGSLGASEGVLDPELTLSEAAAAGPGGLLLYGRLPLMLTRNCPVANGGNCRFSGGDCPGHGRLTDRKGLTFPVVCRWGCAEVLNSRPLWMADRLREVAFAAFGLLWLTDETPDETVAVLAAYAAGAAPAGEYTRGLYYRGSDGRR